jgi:hypothetical protein
MFYGVHVGFLVSGVLDVMGDSDSDSDGSMDKAFFSTPLGRVAEDKSSET